uniref:Uncharacterized protein n=1 Tax=Plectus sambesii TaxID=2011161 RepID=A0A914XER4_9BILA
MAHTGLAGVSDARRQLTSGGCLPAVVNAPNQTGQDAPTPVARFNRPRHLPRRRLPPSTAGAYHGLFDRIVHNRKGCSSTPPLGETVNERITSGSVTTSPNALFSHQ